MWQAVIENDEMVSRESVRSGRSPRGSLVWVQSGLMVVVAAICFVAFCEGGKAGARRPSEGQPERVWLASRVDGRQALVYFDAVRFGTSFPHTAKALYPAAGFGVPMVLPAEYAAAMQRGPEVVHFAIGDKYDLITGSDAPRTATVTAAAGWPGDEEVGNDSYLGALLRLDDPSLPLSEDWFAARRHGDILRGEKNAGAAMLSDPARFDVVTRIASLMNERMRMADGGSNGIAAAPAFTVQRFRLAGGALRYYVRCEWTAEKLFLLAAWIAAEPELHVTGVEAATASYGFATDLPSLLNVVDLGRGRTGAVVSINGEDGWAMKLLEYRDGGLRQMRVLQELSAGE